MALPRLVFLHRNPCLVEEEEGAAVDLESDDPDMGWRIVLARSDSGRRSWTGWLGAYLDHIDFGPLDWDLKIPVACRFITRADLIVGVESRSDVPYPTIPLHRFLLRLSPWISNKPTRRPLWGILSLGNISS